MSSVSVTANATLEMGAATVTGAANVGSLTAIGSDTMTAVAQLTRCNPPQATQSSQKDYTLDGVQIESGGIPQWSDFEGEFITGYVESNHNLLIADAAVNGGRYRNFRVTEPDAGARTTAFIGHVVECNGGPYEAGEQGKSRRWSLKIAVYGTPTVTP